MILDDYRQRQFRQRAFLAKPTWVVCLWHNVNESVLFVVLFLTLDHNYYLSSEKTNCAPSISIFPPKLWNTDAGKNTYRKHYTMKWNLWTWPKDSDFLLTSNSFDQTSVRIFCFSFTDFRPPFFDSEARFTRDCATSQTKIGSSANTSEKSWNGQRFRSSVGKDSKNFIVWGTSQNKNQKRWPRMLTTRWIHQN